MGDAKRRHSKDRRRNRARQVQYATEGFTSYAHLLTNFTGCLGWKPCQDSARMASTTLERPIVCSNLTPRLVQHGPTPYLFALKNDETAPVRTHARHGMIRARPKLTEPGRKAAG